MAAYCTLTTSRAPCHILRSLRKGRNVARYASGHESSVQEVPSPRPVVASGSCTIRFNIRLCCEQTIAVRQCSQAGALADQSDILDSPSVLAYMQSDLARRALEQTSVQMRSEPVSGGPSDGAPAPTPSIDSLGFSLPVSSLALPAQQRATVEHDVSCSKSISEG